MGRRFKIGVRGRKYKIVYVLFDRKNYCGGPTMKAKRLLPEFVRLGHEVHAFILQMGDPGDAADELESKGVRCYQSNVRVPSKLLIRWMLDNLVRIQPDIFMPNLSHIAGYAARYVKPSGVVTIIQHVSDDELNWSMANLFACHPRWATSGVMCISDELMHELSGKRPVAKLKKICNGMPEYELQASQERVQRIVFAGRLENEQKRIHETFESVCRALKRHDHIKFVVIGTGKEENSLKHYVKGIGLDARVDFMGLVPPEKMQYELSKCQILVLLSDYEGLPGAVIEAMMCGLVPVITEMSGGVNELVQGGVTGVVVPDRDASFDRAIDSLIENEGQRKEIARNARKHVSDNYSMRQSLIDWQDFFEELVEHAPPKTILRTPRWIRLPKSNGLLRIVKKPSKLVHAIRHPVSAVKGRIRGIR